MNALTIMLPAVTVSCTSSGSTSGNKLASTLLYSVWFKSSGSPANVIVNSTTSNHVCPGEAGGWAIGVAIGVKGGGGV